MTSPKTFGSTNKQKCSPLFVARIRTNGSASPKVSDRSLTLSRLLFIPFYIFNDFILKFIILLNCIFQNLEIEYIGERGPIEKYIVQAKKMEELEKLAQKREG